MGATILHTSIGQVEGAELVVWVLAAYSALERSHRLFRLDSLRTDDIGYFEIEGDILSVYHQHEINTAMGAVYLQARRRGSLYLLIQRRVGGEPPGHHLAGGLWVRLYGEVMKFFI